MLVKNNYIECITNLACSIQKYFGIEPNHNSIEYVDNILNEKKPDNVVVILFDGMGSRIIDRNLSKDDFFIKHKLKEITTVFPATTTAATTSVRTALNPVEHGWLGWNMYIAPIDKTITLFLNSEKDKKGIESTQFLSVKNKLMNKTVTDQINKQTPYEAFEISNFGGEGYNNLDEMLEKIEDKCKKGGKKYIYAYDTEPDHTMHDYGPDSAKVVELIKMRSKKVEEMYKKLENTVLIIIADHGHKVAESVHLKDYPNIYNMLERTTSIEQRAVSFKIKKEYKEKFVEEFNKVFGNDFKLYSKEEIINSKLFGDGKENELFEDALGDFIAIAEESGKCILTDGDEKLYSHHAGYSDDEIYIPLIVASK